MVTDQMLDRGDHARAVVEDHAGNAGEGDTDAAKWRRPVALGQAGDLLGLAVGGEQGRRHDDTVADVRVQQAEDRVVRRVSGPRTLECSTIDQQQIVAQLATLAVERVPELGLVAAAEGIGAVEQHRNRQAL